MQQNVKYLITRKSDDGTFSPGDLISLREDGSIVAHNNGGGWVNPEDVEAGLRGAEYIVDPGYIAYLEQKSTHLNELLNTAKSEQSRLELLGRTRLA